MSNISTVATSVHDEVPKHLPIQRSNDGSSCRALRFDTVVEKPVWSDPVLPVLCVDFGSMGFLGLLPGPLYMLRVILGAVVKLNW